MSNQHTPKLSAPKVSIGIMPVIPSVEESQQLDALKSSILGTQGIKNPDDNGPIVITEVPERTKEPLILMPFEDGTVVKYLPRGEGSEQQIVVTAKGDQMAITRDSDCAAMITDGVNLLFAAVTEKQALELAAKGYEMAEANKEKPLSEPEAELMKQVTTWLQSQTITSENIGDIRRQLFMPFDCTYNEVIRELTATFELAGSKSNEKV